MTETNQPEKIFSESLRRLVHRETIGKEMVRKNNKDSLRRILDKSRAKLPQIESQIEDVLSKEYSIDTERYEVTGTFSYALENRFPDISGLGILPLGSIIRGGAVIRKLMGRETEASDLDWGIVSDDPIDKETLKKINEYAKESVPRFALKAGLPRIISSSYINGENFNVVNIKSKREAINMIRDMEKDTSDWDPWTNPLILYLGPSIPPEYNQRNRKFLLDGLSQLSLEDHNLWKKTVDQLVDSWRQHLRVKPKHLVGSYTTSERDEEIRQNIIKSSREALSKRMEELLLTTDRSSNTQPKKPSE